MHSFLIRGNIHLSQAGHFIVIPFSVRGRRGRLGLACEALGDLCVSSLGVGEELTRDIIGYARNCVTGEEELLSWYSAVDTTYLVYLSLAEVRHLSVMGPLQ
jgi:hypothetical protein